MSADCRSSNMLHAPYRVCLAQTLSEPEQQTSASLLCLLPAACVANVQLNDDDVLETSFIHIKGIVDGRGLACPMPLLKPKWLYAMWPSVTLCMWSRPILTLKLILLLFVAKLSKRMPITDCH